MTISIAKERDTPDGRRRGITVERATAEPTSANASGISGVTIPAAMELDGPKITNVDMPLAITAAKHMTVKSKGGANTNDRPGDLLSATTKVLSGHRTMGALTITADDMETLRYIRRKIGVGLIAPATKSHRGLVVRKLRVAVVWISYVKGNIGDMDRADIGVLTNEFRKMSMIA
jgi:hypothetical protein